MNNSPGRCLRLLVLSVVAWGITTSDRLRAQENVTEAEGAITRLAVTAHPALPAHPSQYWLVPEAPVSASGSRRPDAAAVERFARGARLVEASEFAQGLPLLDPVALSATPLANYAQYYSGVALQGLSRFAEADAAFTWLAARKPEGYLKEAIPLRIAEVALARQDAKRAVDTLQQLSQEKLNVPEEVILQMGRAAERANDREKALKAYRRLYYDFPMSPQANEAQGGIERLQTAELIPPDRFKLELARAEKLFVGKRWAQSRAAFDSLSRVAQGRDAELTALRIGECDYYLDRHRAARDAMRPYVQHSSREAEARFFYLTATRALGDQTTYVTMARQLVDDFPESSWAEETLNNLATHYLIVDDDLAADAVFRELYQRFPGSRYSERAAWKIGWRAYRSGDFREAAKTFERAAGEHPRADNRPSWLYWSGRARDQLDESADANERYRLVVADYENSYYGRLASKILIARHEPPVSETVFAATTGAVVETPIPTDALVRELVAVQLYDDALREVQYAQHVWGDSPQLQATIAFVRHSQGLGLKAQERFAALRGAITIMRRAYPQFMAAGGEDLPANVLRIIFPLDYWPLIKNYSDAHDLDPYLIAALMAQESTFTAEIRSAANAYGLMQIVPDAGRQYARKMGLGRFSTAMLMQPETNVRIGTQYFKDLSDRFGGAYFALASYNAGPHRVAVWLEEKPALPADEFIDDIPFPETQNYVKRILGTAEDYRRLYGGGLLDPNTSLPITPSVVTTKVAATSSKKSATKPKPAKKPTPTARGRSTRRR